MSDEIKTEAAYTADMQPGGSSYHRMQVALDAALQKHQDDAAAHAAAVEQLKADHVAAVTALDTRHKADRQAVIAELERRHAQQTAETTRLHEEATAKLKTEHEGRVAKLKADVLGPALADLHQRKVADLAAKHAAELEALKNG